MATSPNVTRIPSQRVPILDDKMPGLASRDWYRFFQRLFEITGAGSDATTVTDLQQGPELGAIPDGLAQLARTLDGVQLAPLNNPLGSALRYGSFCRTTTQTAAVVNTAYAVDFTTATLTHGVYQPTSTSKLSADAAGLYLFEFTAQLDSTGAAGNVFIWAAVNGVDVDNSATKHSIASGTTEASVTRSFMLSLSASDYVEIKWSTSNLAVALTSVAAAAPVPLIPAASMNIYRLGEA